MTRNERACTCAITVNRVCSLCAPGGRIVSYEVDPAFVQEVHAAAKPQAMIRQHRDAPEISDPTKTTSAARERLGLKEHESSAYGLPESWIRRLEEAAIPGTGRIEE